MAPPAHRIKATRLARSLSQSALAHRAGISRQALGAIEAGIYQPSVAVALALSRTLGESVESLFGGDLEQRVEAHLSGAADAIRPGAHVALARLAGRVTAVPTAAARIALETAAGIVEHSARDRARVHCFRSPEEIDATVLIAGCDPAVSLLAEWIARNHAPASVVAIPCGSADALAALAGGRAHLAGLHLRDPRSGDYNLAAARRALGRHAVMVRFARWEIGLATAPGNPRGIRGIAGLARRGIRIVNREPGAGARATLDDALRELGIAPGSIAGYDREARGHLEVAAAIAAGQADAGVTIRVAAQAYGLGFVPIREERYDIAIAGREMQSPAVAAVLDALGSGRFAREVGELCGYDTREMGNRIEPRAPAR
jgi:molybdopterin molybdotransferase/putative molybdopterin biosynthesis protein